MRKPPLQCRDYSLAEPCHDLKKSRPQDWNGLVVTVEGRIAHVICKAELPADNFAVPETGRIGLEGDHGLMEYRRSRLKRQSSCVRRNSCLFRNGECVTLKVGDFRLGCDVFPLRLHEYRNQLAS